MSAYKYVGFDWALKSLLREKENFDVLNGFLSTVLDKTVTVDSLGESESNQDGPKEKQCRIDLLAYGPNRERYAIEVQRMDQPDYFQRILFSSSEQVYRSILKGGPYAGVKKVYHISLVYFDLGKGEDCVYHGGTEFVGMFKHDKLGLSEDQKAKFGVCGVGDLYPEYYLLMLRNFSGSAGDNEHLSEWLHFLKTADIAENPTAPGLREAQEKLQYLKLSDSDRVAYERFLHEERIMMSVWDNMSEKKFAEGRAVGMAQGMAQGRAEGLAEGERKKAIESALKMKQMKYDTAVIAQIFGLTEEEIRAL